MRRSISLFTLLAALLSAPLAWAEPSATELAVARRLFKEATELEGKSEYRVARDKLKEALAIKETPGIRFHLGHCNEQLGEYVAAMVEYERALDLIHGGAKAPDVERVLTPAKERVQAKLAQLTLRLPGDVKEATVELDGRRLASSVLGQAAPLDPGKHQIVVAAAGYKRRQIELSLREGEQRALDIVLERERKSPAGAAPATTQPSSQPAASPAPEPALAPASTGEESVELDSGAPSGMGTREFVLIGEVSVALVGVGIGVGYLLVRSGAQDRATTAQGEIDALSNGDNAACSSNDSQLRAACGDLDAAIEDYDRAGLISTVGFVAAGVGAGAAALTFALWRPASNQPALLLGPARAGVGLAASGRF